MRSASRGVQVVLRPAIRWLMKDLLHPAERARRLMENARWRMSAESVSADCSRIQVPLAHRRYIGSGHILVGRRVGVNPS